MPLLKKHLNIEIIHRASLLSSADLTANSSQVFWKMNPRKYTTNPFAENAGSD